MRYNKEETLTFSDLSLRRSSPLSTLSAAPIAVLRRSLKFKQLAIRSILGLTIGGVFGIALAVAGAGVCIGDAGADAADCRVHDRMDRRASSLWPHLVGAAFPRTPSGRPQCLRRTHNGYGDVRRIATLQCMTVAAKVLCAAMSLDVWCQLFCLHPQNQNHRLARGPLAATARISRDCVIVQRY
jgi:hypothetical protein